MVYRFKVTYEDHEDVYRHIEIKSSQTFLEFHTAIQQSIGFDNSKQASFYRSDDYWRKEEEIATENTGDDKAKRPKPKRGDEPVKKKTIADFIESPHQHFVYVFDPEKEWTFLIELIKIVPVDAGVSYPQCIKTVGNSPKQYKPTNLPPPPVEEDDEVPAKIKATAPEKEEPEALVLEKEPNEEEDGFIPLDEDGVEDLGDDTEKAPADDDEEPAAEEEDGESSLGFDFEEEDER